MRKKILLGTFTMLIVWVLTETMGIQKLEAAEIQKVYMVSATEGEIIPYADVIIIKYRMNNGKLEYRRWNETKGYWVDSEWLPVD